MFSRTDKRKEPMVIKAQIHDHQSLSFVYIILFMSIKAQIKH